VNLTSKQRIRNVCSLEMTTLLALLITTSRVKSRSAVLSMPHRLTWPYSLDFRVLSIPSDNSQLMDGWMRVVG
jgi:hypothetical protein